MKNKALYILLTIVFAIVFFVLKSMTFGIATAFGAPFVLAFFFCYIIAGFKFAGLPKKTTFDYVLYYLTTFFFLFAALTFTDKYDVGPYMRVVHLFPDSRGMIQEILCSISVALTVLLYIVSAIYRNITSIHYAKNVILIHGINGIPKMFEWLKNQLENEGIDVIMPSFPPQEGTIYEDWAKIFDQYIDSIQPGSIVVCHSIGNEFLIRYFSEKNFHVQTYIGLAGFAKTYYNDGKDVLNTAVEKFLVNDNQIELFKKSTSRRYAIYSDDDHIVPFEVLEEYPKQIGAKPILIRGIGHMGKKSGLEEFPELFDLVKEEFDK